MSKIREPGSVYRQRAAKVQRLADDATLPNVREMHTAAAVRWTLLADRADRVAAKALVEGNPVLVERE